MSVSFPTSIREINALPDVEKVEIYKTLIPTWVHQDFDIDSNNFTHDSHQSIFFRCPVDSRAVEITVKRQTVDLDPILYLNMADTFNNQLLVLLVQVNDPTSLRFNTDIDGNGNPTNFGTTSRNIPAEVAAKAYGLAPGQIRSGLRSFRTTVPLFEEFISNMGHDIFFIEPLAYHNAIIFERYGFNYVRGLQDMNRIHSEFQIGGIHYQKLDDKIPFRRKASWESIRGRSWAIHDGILGHPFTGFQMYKQISNHAEINTFPHAIW